MSDILEMQPAVTWYGDKDSEHNEYAKLEEAVDVLVHKGRLRDTEVVRTVDVDADGQAVGLSQELYASGYAATIHIRPDGMRSGKWFRNRLENMDGFPALSVNLGEQTVDGFNTWWLPPDAARPLTLGNVGLLDVFTKEVVAPDDPDYERRSRQIIGWTLEELDNPLSRIQVQRWWGRSVEGWGNARLRMLQDALGCNVQAICQVTEVQGPTDDCNGSDQATDVYFDLADQHNRKTPYQLRVANRQAAVMHKVGDITRFCDPNELGRNVGGRLTAIALAAIEEKV